MIEKVAILGPYENIDPIVGEQINASLFQAGDLFVIAGASSYAPINTRPTLEASKFDIEYPIYIYKGGFDDFYLYGQPESSQIVIVVYRNVSAWYSNRQVGTSIPQEVVGVDLPDTLIMSNVSDSVHVSVIKFTTPDAIGFIDVEYEPEFTIQADVLDLSSEETAENSSVIADKIVGSAPVSGFLSSYVTTESQIVSSYSVVLLEGEGLFGSGDILEDPATDSSSNQIIATLTTNETSLDLTEVSRTLQNLLPHQRYAIRVRAYNEFNVFSDWSEALEVETEFDKIAPDPPFQFRSIFDSPDLYISWRPPPNNEDGSPCEDLSHYEITLTGVNSSISLTLNVSQEYLFLSRSFIDAYLGKDPEIQAKIQSVDTSGNTSDFVYVNATNDPPTSPTYTVEPIGGGVQFSVSNTYPDLLHFTLYESEDGVSFGEAGTFFTNSFIYTNVQLGVTKYFKLYAVDFYDQISPVGMTVEVLPQNFGEDKHYVHIQASPLTIWAVEHNLDKLPTIECLDGDGVILEGAISYDDPNTVTIEFNSAQSGQAICN